MTDAEASNTVTFIGLVDRVNYGRRTNVPGVDHHQQHIENTVVLRPWKTAGATTKTTTRVSLFEVLDEWGDMWEQIVGRQWYGRRAQRRPVGRMDRLL